MWADSSGPVELAAHAFFIAVAATLLAAWIPRGLRVALPPPRLRRSA
jgi:hypothetical protein